MSSIVGKGTGIVPKNKVIADSLNESATATISDVENGISDKYTEAKVVKEYVDDITGTIAATLDAINGVV